MLYREVHTELTELLTFFPVVAIVGPRQVGKTTLAKELNNSIGKESVYLDLENPKDVAKITDPVLFFESNTDKCVVLDEIQRMPELFPILRSMVDMNRVPARFILLGSASPELIRDSSETLAGRIIYQELTPFNLTEIGSESSALLNQHWFRGGFPDAFLARSDKMTSKWRSAFIQTYLERDLPLLGLDADHLVIRKLWVMVAHIHGNLLNMSSLGKSLGITSKTVRKYLSFMEQAFLIRLLKPYTANIGKRLVKSPKAYIRDSGLMHQLLGITAQPDLEFNPVVGHSWEGYVIEQITQKLPDGVFAYYYRTHEGAECDLVLEKGGKCLAAIEVKYVAAPKISKGLFNAYADLNAKHNFIVTPQTDDYLIRKDVRVCKLYDMLTVYLPELLG